MADYSLVSPDRMRAQTARDLMKANQLTERFGLRLSAGAAARIAERRFQALRDSGRVEFGRGILRALIEAFCDSPFIQKEDYEETVCELIDSFHYFRDLSDGLISDEDLIDCMRGYFDRVCQGSLERLNGAEFSELIRGASGLEEEP